MKYPLRTRVKNRLRREVLKRVGLDLRVNHHLDSMISVPREDVERIVLYSPQVDVTAPSTVHPDDVVTYSYPRRYVYRIPGASIDPVNGLIYDRDGKLIAESTSWPTNRLLYEVTQPSVRPPKRVLPGEFVFFGSNHNYYHWLLEDLPVFLAAHEAAPSASVLVPDGNFPLSEAFLERYVTARKVSFHALIRVESLVVCGKTSALGSPYHHNVVHPRDVALVKKWVEERVKGDAPGGAPTRDVYVSRVGLRRSYAGEEQVEAGLRDAGFEIFRGMATLEEQVRYFTDVRRLVGCSGAGLVNMMWMPSDAAFTQLLDTGGRYGFYPYLAHLLNLRSNALDVMGSTPDAICRGILGGQR